MVGQIVGRCRRDRLGRHGWYCRDTRRARPQLFPNFSYKAHPLAVDSADQALCRATVADSPTNCADSRRNCEIRHDAPPPDGGNQVGLADYPMAIHDKIDEQIVYLRLNRDSAPAVTEFAEIGVQ